MTITIRPAQERGHANWGWLDTHHTFSFANYYDPRFMGYGALRVLNEDRVVPGEGFGTHPHRNLEILTYVVDGTLAHKDSMGTGSEVTPGEIQYMSAGTGVTHSEFNASKVDPLHFLQIWIVPASQGGAPRYDQRRFTPEERRNRLLLLASGDGEDGAIQIKQDARLFTSWLEAGRQLRHISPGRRLWIQVVRGALSANGELLEGGDGAAVEGADTLVLDAHDDSEVLLFDLV